MEEEFISFETAKLAKEKGFDINCSTAYMDKVLRESFLLKGYHNKGLAVLAPTQSLLQKWLREIHNININIDLYIYESDYKKCIYRCKINYFKNHGLNSKYVGLNNYEKTFEIGLQEALKLIKDE